MTAQVRGRQREDRKTDGLNRLLDFIAVYSDAPDCPCCQAARWLARQTARQIEQGELRDIAHNQTKGDQHGSDIFSGNKATSSSAHGH